VCPKQFIFFKYQFNRPALGPPGRENLDRLSEQFVSLEAVLTQPGKQFSLNAVLRIGTTLQPHDIVRALPFNDGPDVCVRRLDGGICERRH
jgi:hypothetical protein